MTTPTHSHKAWTIEGGSRHTDEAGNPKPQAQRNFTDPASHILKGDDGWIQGYNAQAAVDGDHQVIVAIVVSNQGSDAVHLLPMLERIETNTGQQPDALIADAGYCSTANLKACEARGLEAYISTSRQQHGYRARPSRGRPLRDLDARGRMDRKLRSKAGQVFYALRKTIAEPVFGQIKGARGLDRFLLRGLEKVNGEWPLIATTHNLLNLFRTSLATALRAWRISPSCDRIVRNPRSSITTARSQRNVRHAPRWFSGSHANRKGGNSRVCSGFQGRKD